jgi:hypothetical protein
MRSACSILAQRPGGKRPLGRPGYKKEGFIKMCLENYNWEMRTEFVLGYGPMAEMDAIAP